MPDFGRLLKIASNQLFREFDKFAKRYAMSGTQMTLIAYLSHNKDREILQRDVEFEFNIQRSTATVLLQRMEKRNLIVRDAASCDGRQRRIRLTAHAQKLEEDIQAYIAASQKKIVTGLSEHDIKVIEAFLLSIIHHSEGGEDKK